ncbi:MAG TPA: YraN family protein [Candidatus Acidoferrales bacterium]|nr:YraN family protein [Candidatus Acidoferrales bacterium]
MALLSRAIFGCMRLAARHGLAESRDEGSAKDAARRTGIHGETYAYWYLRRHGYVFVARNYRIPDDKGEIDLVGYDGSVLAFIEVKTRSGTEEHPGQPEEAITAEKRRHLERMAKRFMAERRARDVSWRFDLVAIENRAGRVPQVRLYKNAFAAKY